MHSHSGVFESASLVFSLESSQLDVCLTSSLVISLSSRSNQIFSSCCQSYDIVLNTSSLALIAAQELVCLLKSASWSSPNNTSYWVSSWVLGGCAVSYQSVSIWSTFLLSCKILHCCYHSACCWLKWSSTSAAGLSTSLYLHASTFRFSSIDGRLVSWTNLCTRAFWEAFKYNWCLLIFSFFRFHLESFYLKLTSRIYSCLHILAFMSILEDRLT